MLILIWVHKCDTNWHIKLNVSVDELSVMLLGLDQLSAAPLSLQIDNIKILRYINVSPLLGVPFRWVMWICVRNRKPYIIPFIAVSLLQTGLEAGKKKNKSADLLQHQGFVFFSWLLIAFKTVLMPNVIGPRGRGRKNIGNCGEKKKK